MTLSLDKREEELFEALTSVGKPEVTLEEIRSSTGNFTTAEIYFEACKEEKPEALNLYEKALQYYSSESSLECVRLQVAKLWYDAFLSFRAELDEEEMEMRPFTLDLAEFVQIGVVMKKNFSTHFQAGSSQVPEKLRTLAIFLKKHPDQLYLGDYLLNMLGWIKNFQDIYTFIAQQIEDDPEEEEGYIRFKLLNSFMDCPDVVNLHSIFQEFPLVPKENLQIIGMLRSFRQAMIRENELFKAHNSEALEKLLEEYADQGIFFSQSQDDQVVYLAELKEYESRQEINIRLLDTVYPHINLQLNLKKIFDALISVPTLCYRHFEILNECFKAHVEFDTLKELFSKYFNDRLDTANHYITQKRKVDVSAALDSIKSDIKKLDEHKKPSSFLCC